MQTTPIYLWIVALITLAASSYVSWEVALSNSAGSGLFFASAAAMVVSLGVLLYGAILAVLQLDSDSGITNEMVEVRA